MGTVSRARDCGFFSSLVSSQSTRKPLGEEIVARPAAGRALPAPLTGGCGACAQSACRQSRPATCLVEMLGPALAFLVLFLQGRHSPGEAPSACGGWGGGAAWTSGQAHGRQILPSLGGVARQDHLELG